MPTRSDTPNRVRRERERRFWTLRKLAALAELDHTHLSKIERGVMRPNGITQERLAQALGIDRDVLFPEPELEEATG